jgi:hypothetical protein
LNRNPAAAGILLKRLGATFRLNDSGNWTANLDDDETLQNAFLDRDLGCGWVGVIQRRAQKQQQSGSGTAQCRGRP